MKFCFKCALGQHCSTDASSGRGGAKWNRGKLWLPTRAELCLHHLSSLWAAILSAPPEGERGGTAWSEKKGQPCEICNEKIYFCWFPKLARKVFQCIPPRHQLNRRHSSMGVCHIWFGKSLNGKRNFYWEKKEWLTRGSHSTFTATPILGGEEEVYVWSLAFDWIGRLLAPLTTVFVFFWGHKKTKHK